MSLPKILVPKMKGNHVAANNRLLLRHQPQYCLTAGLQTKLACAVSYKIRNAWTEFKFWRGQRPFQPFHGPSRKVINISWGQRHACWTILHHMSGRHVSHCPVFPSLLLHAPSVGSCMLTSQAVCVSMSSTLRQSRYGLNQWLCTWSTG